MKIKAFLLSIILTSGTVTGEETLTFNDFKKLKKASSLVISHDGKTLFWQQNAHENDSNTYDIWRMPFAGGEAKRITFDQTYKRDLTLDNKGQWLYFARNGKNHDDEYTRQLFRMRLDGSKLMQITHLKKGLQSFQLIGNSIYYSTSREQKVQDEWSNLRSKFSDVIYQERTYKPGSIYHLDLSSRKTALIIKSKRVIEGFSVSPQEDRLAMITVEQNELIYSEGFSEVEIHRIKGQAYYELDDTLWRAKAPTPYGYLANLRWSADNQALSLEVSYDGYPTEIIVAEFNKKWHGKAKRVWQLNRNGKYQPRYSGLWRGQTRDFCYVGADWGYYKAYCIEDVKNGKQGSIKQLSFNDRTTKAFQFTRDGKNIVISANTQISTEELFTASYASTPDWKQVTKLNSFLEEKALPSTKHITWTSSDGSKTGAIIEFPPGYDKSKGPYPTLISLHGGPTYLEAGGLEVHPYGRGLHSAKGYVIFAPNYRGSTGYGDKFTIDLVGNKNNLDIQDIMTGLQKIIDEGIADKDRLGVFGWSNGGYLTNLLIIHTDQFKAASSGAGVFDTGMQWAIKDTPGTVINFSKGMVWDLKEKQLRTSPMYHMENVTTPTLIHVGELDERVPKENSIALHRALKHYLNVPTELIIYPGAYHFPRKKSHEQAKLKWELFWFEKYILMNDK